MVTYNARAFNKIIGSVIKNNALLDKEASPVKDRRKKVLFDRASEVH
jgi:hypothetical protein